ncbi:hypothetical protein UVI_02044200 [Ustilaginoidea virens]|uniref:Uncharacterized protein n=1 Tax=Ustilaginoidea virens TaxID=1159556 RepID=A0A1B5L7W1_USTVR|nr:hypothetical protein UVI_02044200 [Ustilaginoidea virens]
MVVKELIMVPGGGGGGGHTGRTTGRNWTAAEAQAKEIPR